MPEHLQEPQKLQKIESMSYSESRMSGKKKGAVIGGSIAVILAAIFANEGGYVDHPNDPGGKTNFGITEKVARGAGYKGDMRYFPKYCNGPEDICARDIYLENYIRKPGFIPIIELEPAVGLELVDSSVNFGPVKPSKWFQESLNELGDPGLMVDGEIGPRTIDGYKSLQVRYGKVLGCRFMLDRLDAKQLKDYYRQVAVNPKKQVFLKGWKNKRINNVDRDTCGKGLT